MALKFPVMYVLSLLSLLVFKSVPPDRESYHLYFSPLAAPLADNVTGEEVPIQRFAPVVVGVEEIALIDKSLPLIEPVFAGLLLTILILYPVPVIVFTGNVLEMVPATVDVKVPILTGETKLPVAFDSCAVNIFPELKVPETVNGTDTIDPAQNGKPVIIPVEIVCWACAKTK